MEVMKYPGLQNARAGKHRVALIAADDISSRQSDAGKNLRKLRTSRLILSNPDYYWQNAAVRPKNKTLGIFFN